MRWKWFQPWQRQLSQRRILAPALLIFAGFLSLIFFQNFSEVPIENLKPKFYDRKPASLSESAGFQDIRSAAPSREAFEAQLKNSETIAQPKSGKDLSSISEDWAKRQAELLTGGVEKKLLENINKTVHRALSSEDDRTEDPLENDSDALSADHQHSSMASKVKLSGLNKMEVAIAERSNVTCTVDGSALQLDLSRSLSQSFDINLRHHSGSSKSSVMINYSW